MILNQVCICAFASTILALEVELERLRKLVRKYRTESIVFAKPRKSKSLEYSAELRSNENSDVYESHNAVSSLNCEQLSSPNVPKSRCVQFAAVNNCCESKDIFFAKTNNSQALIVFQIQMKLYANLTDLHSTAHVFLTLQQILICHLDITQYRNTPLKSTFLFFHNYNLENPIEILLILPWI